MKHLLKQLWIWYVTVSSRNSRWVNFNLACLRMLYKLPRMHAYIDRLVYHFQKIYKSIHADPLLKEVRLKNGLYMCVDTMDRLGGLLYFYRNYSERITQEFLQQHLQAGDIFVDVGANCGFYSLLAAQHVKPNGKVYAFEANPSVCKVFSQSIGLNRFEHIVTLENYAVANVSGKTLEFYLPSDKVNSAIGTLISNGQMASSGNIDTTQSINVLTVTLDEYLKNKQIDGKLFIKIDAEGAEEWVLQGMHNLLLQRIPYCIILESDSPDSVSCKQIEAYGYQLQLADIFTSYSRFGNYIFVNNA